MAKRATIAIVYDFDGTLSPGNMQEYDFISQLRIPPKRFWREAEEKASHDKADKILTYMHLMLEKAHTQGISVHKTAFRAYGRNIVLFDGVRTWFERINQYGKSHKSNIEHYIVSSGIYEMLDATPIKKHFKKIFASSFVYNNSGVACWPAIAINYTTKTQFLFRINKGCLDISDDSKINKYVPQEERPVPFSRIIYIGDGSTDVPCMKLVKEQGGHSIAVYKPRASRKKALSLIKQGRVNHVLPADFRKGRPLEKVVKLIIQQIEADFALKQLAKIRHPKTMSLSNSH